jgi:8-amino-7-oxononanoate synthase
MVPPPRRTDAQSDPLDWITAQLHELESLDLKRDLPTPLTRQSPTVAYRGQTLVNLASNDYLGLAADPRVVQAAVSACQASGVGRGASPLVCGRAEAHCELERRLAQFEQTEAALLFPSGFAANAGVIPALVDQPDALFADAANHASLIDGCRLSRADRHIYPHGDCDRLAELLRTTGPYRRRLIVTDSLFSMEGDLAPLEQIADLAEEFDAMLLVDEAHATGVLGSHGRGAIELLDDRPASGKPLRDRVSVRIGTLSKALGAAGGFVCGSSALVQWLANRARSYVFSTASPAALAAAAQAALEISQAEPQRRETLRRSSQALRDQLQEDGWNTARSAAHIVPLVVGSPQAALGLASELRRRGFWAPGIRPPSVAEGHSLVRLSLRADLPPESLVELRQALRAVRDRFVRSSRG